MTDAILNLTALVATMADRSRSGRTEATLQAQLHALLISASIGLDADDLRDITIESPAGERRRIDIEVGFTIVELKKDLRIGRVREGALAQLAGYVRQRVHALSQRYVGVLTDGAEWAAYHLVGDTLHLATAITVRPDQPDVEQLLTWLEGVLATTQRLQPTPPEIVKRLGADSSSYALDVSSLSALYDEHADDPNVCLKRELWGKLLTTALGTNFTDEPSLFVNHTLLVLTAELIAHAMVGFDLNNPDLSPATVVTGALFARAQISGVVEADFFDWVAEVAGGDLFVRTLARRLARFEWAAVEHDVMKSIYESVIPKVQRHDLGEYYTPDWLAEAIVDEVVDDPLNQRVLDPACGSGTFLFHAVRAALVAEQRAGQSDAGALASVTERIVGVDVHPVAVTLARVTYLLAIGRDRLQAFDRPPFSVPVYLGDSMQWGQARGLLTSDALTVATNDGAQLFADELRFPDKLLHDAGRFDRFVSELADKAAERPKGSPVPSLTSVFRRYEVDDSDREMVGRTFAAMCRLHDEDRDHIWGYYVRNLARPVWLSHEANRVDRIVGNPPWLAFRHMTPMQKVTFRAMSVDHGLWEGGKYATHQDLSALFVARSVELYLRDGGVFGMVMPLGVVNAPHWDRFRSGQWSSAETEVAVDFKAPWDLDAVKPSFFPIKAGVVYGRRQSRDPGALPVGRVRWRGRLVGANPRWSDAKQLLERGPTVNDALPSMEALSPYHEKFVQGATVTPRVLFVVTDQSEPQPLGTGAGRRVVRSRRSANEKQPWKALPPMHGSVETHFAMSLYGGESLLPFGLADPMLAVIPWDGQRLLEVDDDRIDLYPGLADWWRRANELWLRYRSSDKLTLRERLDYHRGLTNQFPIAAERVVYSTSGQYLAAARLTDPFGVVDTKLYWAPVRSTAEALYLCAFLNCERVTARIAPFQSRGEHNPRDFHKLVWRLPIPLFNPDDPDHAELVALATRAEGLVADADLTSTRFEKRRAEVRELLRSRDVAQKTNQLVDRLLDEANAPISGYVRERVRPALTPGGAAAIRLALGRGDEPES